MDRPTTHLREVATLFTRLGFTAFGGPAAHLALIENEVVHRRRWLDRRHFLDLLAAVNFIPGPNSTEVVIHLGLIRAGYPGLVVAGACFILPAVLIILPLAWLYAVYGTLPQVQSLLTGINACVVAIVASAMWRFAQAALVDRFTVCIAAAAAIAGFFASSSSAPLDLLILGIAGLLGAAWYGRIRANPLPMLSAPLPLGLTAATVSAAGYWPQILSMGLMLLKIGATLFGSGYVLVSYLQSGFVDQHGWLNKRQLLDAVAIGQVTPGPLLTTATFIGYILGYGKFSGGAGGGIVGAMIATVAIFLPSFVFIALLGPIMPRIRANDLARGALNGVNAAVVALIFVVATRLAQTAFKLDMLPRAHPAAVIFTLAVGSASLLALLRWNINTTWLIAASAGLGVLGHFLGWT